MLTYNMDVEPRSQWLRTTPGVLALAQVRLGPYLDLGIAAAGALSVGGAFPAAALAGLCFQKRNVFVNGRSA